MARKVNAGTRQDLLQAVRERYRSGTKDEKLRILDELVAVTGYHRKHAIRMFRVAPVAGVPVRRPQLRLYDEAVREALVVLWEASDRVCGKRLKPLLPILVAALERHGHLALISTVRARVLAASAATLDRLLASTRAAISGQRARRRAMPAVQRGVPVRTFADWNDPLPGDMEADLVSHGGESTAGSFVHTLTLADVASGWTECVALVIRDGALVVAALDQVRSRMPFPPDASLDGFLTGLATAWRRGEVRATHRVEPGRARDWRTRTDPFATVWPRVVGWLEAEPDSIGRQLFERLQAEQAGVFPDGQLRTFQRRVKEWRRAAARDLVFAPSQGAA